MAENWWDAAPRVDRPSKGGQWWEAAPTLDETLPATPDFTNVRSGASSVPGGVASTAPLGEDPDDRAIGSLSDQNRAFKDRTTFGGRLRDNIRRGWLGLQANIAAGPRMAQIERGAEGAETGDVMLGTDPLGMPIYASQAYTRGQLPGVVDAQVALGDAVAGDLAQRVAPLQAEMAALPQRPATEALLKADTFREGLGALLIDPLGVIGDIGVPSTVQMGPALAASAVVRRPAFTAGAMGATSAINEFGSSVVGYLADQGVDVADPEALQAALGDPELVRGAANEARVRSGIIGSVDAASGGLAGRTLVPQAVARSAAGREAVNVLAAQPLVQAAMGAGGEAAAQFATRGEIKPGEVLAEALGEMFMTPAEVGPFAVQRGIDAARSRRGALGGSPEDGSAQPPPRPAAPQPAPDPAPPRPRQEAPPPDDIDTLLLRNIPQEEAPVAPEPARVASMTADAAPEAPNAAEAAARLSEVEGAGIRAESAPEVQDTLPPDATFEEFAQWTAARAQAELPQQIEQMREALPRYERDAALAAEQAALRPNDPTAQQFALEEEAALEYLRARLEDAENGRVPEAEPEMLRGAYEMWRERQQPEVTQVAPDAMPDATSAAAMRSPDAPQEQGGLPSEGVGDVRPLPASRPDSRVDDTPPAPLDIRYGKPRTPPGRNAPRDDGETGGSDLESIARRMGDADADRLGLREAVEKALGKAGERVIYIRDYQGLPEHLRRSVERRLEQRGGKGRPSALYDPRTQRVYVYTAVNNTPAKALRSAAHEIAGHHGLRTLLGDRLDHALNIALQNPTVKAVADAIAEHRKLRGDQRLLAAEEALAELAAVTRTGDYDLIRRAYGVEVPAGMRASVKRAVDNFLRRLKAMVDDIFGRHVFSDEDVRDLLEAAWQAVDGGQTLSMVEANGRAAFESVDGSDAVDTDQTQTPEFKRWFGDSKVVDAQGRPLVVYHGSPDARFMDADATFMSLNDRYGAQQGVGAFWFAADRSTAASYADDRRAFDYQNAEPRVIPAYLKLENPLIVDGRGREWREAQAIGKTTDVIKRAQAEGHDGVIIRNVRDNYNNTPRTRPTDTFVVFNSRQIKSAIGNRGTFDPDNPSILESVDPNNPSILREGDDIIPYVATDDSVAGGQGARAAGGDSRRSANVDEVTGLPMNDDGTVTVYHHTSADRAESIRRDGLLRADAEPDVYVTTRAETDTGYGDTAVPIRVDPARLELDDEFPNGRRDFRINVGRPGGSIRVRVENDPTAPGPSGAQESTETLESVDLTPEQQDFMRKAGMAPDTRTTRQKMLDWARGVLPDIQKDSLIAGTLDAYYGLKQAVQRKGGATVETDPYIAARMINIASTMEAILRFGAPKMEGGALRVNRDVPGLFDALRPVQDNLPGFFGWMVARRAKLLKEQGREQLMSDADIQAGLSLRNGHEAAFDEAARNYLRLKNAILDFAEQHGGTIDPAARAAWDHAEYIPFYREDGEGGVAGPGTKRGLTHQSAGIRRLKGGEQNLRDPLANIIQNFTRLMDSALKNRAMQLAVDQLGDTYFKKVPPKMAPGIIPLDQVKKHLLAQGVDQATIDAMPQAALKGVAKMLTIEAPTGDNVVRVMREGKPEYYEVEDPLLLRALTAFNENPTPAWMKPLVWAKNLLTAGATSTPDFLIRNAIRDTGEASVTAREHFIPVVDTAKGAIESAMMDDFAQDLMMAGSYFHGGLFHQGQYEATSRAIERALRRHGMGEGKAERFVKTLANPKRMWDLYRAGIEATEMGSRVSLARNRMKATGSFLESAFEAKDFLDFTLKGDAALLQFFIRVIPFLNARLQGAYRLARAGTAKDRRRRVLARMAVMALASTALYAWNMLMHRDAYDDLEEWDKDAYWHFAPGTDYHIRLPKPFELGLLAGTAVERATAALVHAVTGGEAGDRSDQTLAALLHGITDTMAINPVPQAFKPAVEVYFNYNTFSDRPIESRGDEFLPPSERKTPHTSDFAAWVSGVLEGAVGEENALSPKQLQHLWRGYTGGMGMYLLNAADAGTRWLEGAPPKPESRLRDMPGIGALYRSGQHHTSRWVDEFYDLREVAQTQSNKVKSAMEAGEPGRARNLEAEYGWLLGGREESKRAKGGFMHSGVRAIERAGREMAQLRKADRQIYESREMSPAEKRRRLDENARRRNEIAREMVRKLRAREREQGR